MNPAINWNDIAKFRQRGKERIVTERRRFGLRGRAAHGMCWAMAEPRVTSDIPRKIALAGAALALGMIGFYALALAPRDAMNEETRIAQGAVIYRAHCAGCHGANLQGQADWKQLNAAGRLPAPPLDGTGHGWRHSNAELFHMVKFSVLDQAGPDYQTDMPAFDRKLSDDDIRAVLAFIHSRWSPNIQAAQAFLNPDHEGMPDHVEGDWRLPADCEEPLRGRKALPPPQ